MIEVSELFQDLNKLVAEQDDNIIKIEQTGIRVVDNAEQANDKLTDATDIAVRTRSRKKLIVALALILVIVVVIAVAVPVSMSNAK
ncbi:hypothetical protein H2198_006250 [Neophaeococcomyces mojaviensis]|uniref:Uncharacterized protein n=1 Tax=Neophaeococcomyces mojaviensis TaxID=3383035 RepID=A0ACC3A3B0_9EURO|nr:hypothetical protein H2198_006250 [Knufia sp. JES_112]